MAEPMRIDIAEFREQGYLHEVNRLILHPLGLALEVVIKSDGSARLGGIWDSRDDPEGMQYGDDLLSPEKGKNVSRLWHERMPTREKALGYMIQPLDGCPALNLSFGEVKAIVARLEPAESFEPVVEAIAPTLDKLCRYIGELEAIFGPQ